MNASKNTLVILTPGFAADEQDFNCLPAQQSFLLAAQKLAPELEIVVLAFQYPYHSKPYRWHGIDVIPFNGQNKGGLKKILLFQRIKKKLDRLRPEKNICGLLSFWYTECGYVAKKFADRHDLTHRCWIWGRDAQTQNKFPKRLRPRADELVTLSDFLQDEFEKNHGVRPAQVIPFGIDPSLFSTSLPQKDIDLLAAGSLIPLKQFELFIEAVAQVKKEKPMIKAMLAGSGPEEGKLRTKAAALGLTNTLQFQAELPHPELLKQMERTKIFLHPSFYEGFGAVNLEALYAGAQVISFVRPMKNDIVNWQFASTVNDMAKRAIKILNDESRPNSRELPFPVETSTRKLLTLFACQK